MTYVIRNDSKLKDGEAIQLVRDWVFGNALAAVKKAKAMRVNMRTAQPEKATVAFVVYDDEEDA